VEETPNHLGGAQPPHTLEMGWEKEARIQRGMRSPLYSWETRYPYMSGTGAGHVQLTRYVWARGQTCLVKTVSAVPETSKPTRKLDTQRILV
jgi:hypothetical protein